MMLKVRKFLNSVFVIALGVGVFACTDDEKAVEEPVTPVATEEPATPPEEVAPAPVEISPATVYFGFDEFTLSSQAQDKLSALADQMRANAAAIVQIEGHCDERGSIEYNLALGERRAFAVKEYLVNLGVEESRLTTVSYGEGKPSMEGHDESAWSQNRRAEFIISNQ